MSRSAGRRFPDGSPCDGREVREGTLAGSFARKISVNLGTLGDFQKKKEIIVILRNSRWKVKE